MHSMSQTSHTVTHQSTNPTQAFVSPLGVAPQEVASVHSAPSHHSTYRPVPVNVAPQQRPQPIAVPPSVDQHHNQPNGYHLAAAPPLIAQRNQMPIDEISVRQGYQQGNLPRQIFQGNQEDQLSSNHSSYSYHSGGPSQHHMQAQPPQLDQHMHFQAHQAEVQNLRANFHNLNDTVASLRNEVGNITASHRRTEENLTRITIISIYQLPTDTLNRR